MQGEPQDTDPADPAEPVAEPRTLPFVQLLPNLVTLLGLCAGLTSIRYALQGGVETAAALIVLAAVVDGLDGLLARKLNAASHFGAELDSLSDFVCFGVAPGILVYATLLQDAPPLDWLCVLVFVLSACLRLARFNVSRAAPPPLGGAHFVGVPAPAGAMLALLPVYLMLAGWLDLRGWPLPTGAYVAFVGVLMISRLPTPSPKAWRVPRNRAVLLLLAVTLYGGALATRPWLVLVLSDLLYLAVLARGAWQQRSRPV